MNPSHRSQDTTRPSPRSDRSNGQSELLCLEGVEHSYGEVGVLRGVSQTVDKGQTVVIIGPSGSGKSTLLRCINALEPIKAGSIQFRGRDIATWDENELRRHIGMVFQQFNLFPHKTVLGNLILAPVSVLGAHKAESEERAHALLQSVGLADHAGRYPHELSGGQQQRVAIARALMMSPDIMLFDEVTSALDPELVGGVLAVMKDLASGGMTMVVVTHEMNFARDVGTHLVFMADGVIVEQGEPRPMLANPQSARLQQFLSHMRT